MKKPLFERLYFQVLVGITLGVIVGFFEPHWGESLKPLGDGFIKLIKMMIAPIIFVTLVHGIAKMKTMKEVGRVGLKALIYFELVTTVALILGLAIGNLWKPGVGINADPAQIDTSTIDSYTQSAKNLGFVDFILNIIPTTFFDAFMKGEIIQVLFIALLFGFALSSMGARAKPFTEAFEGLSEILFGIIHFIMKLAPIGAFGAMAFTVGKFGVGALLSLGQLMLSVYLACILFVFLILGAIASAFGFSIWKILKYIRDEILIVLGTSSSESVLPRMIKKMEDAGCAESVVGLVIPAGYSFNLDGTCIYLTAAVLFIAQATNTPLDLGGQIAILALLLLTSKGAAAVTGGGFITLAATLASTHRLPVAGIALLIGVDRFMSEARAITNLIGNAVATLVISQWEGELDKNKANALLRK